MGIKRKEKIGGKSRKVLETAKDSEPPLKVDADLELSSDEEELEEATEIDAAIVDYTEGLADKDAFDDAASDSSEEERPQRNTVGDVPLQWYSDEEHIGYDVEGERIVKKDKKDKLDQLLDRNDSAEGWRTVYDNYNDEEIVLSKEEMRMIQNIRSGRFPHAEVNPYPDENDWFTREQEMMPLSGAPEPKRRFTPSKWEEKKIVKLVRAIRKGWLTSNTAPKKPEVYLMWAEDGEATDKTVSGLAYLAAPKMKLPGHDESYNPPQEYLLNPDEEEAAKQEAEEKDEPAPFIPKTFEALRKVPAYERYINERFERCLDLYLCPRSRMKRMDLSGTLNCHFIRYRMQKTLSLTRMMFFSCRSRVSCSQIAKTKGFATIPFRVVYEVYWTYRSNQEYFCGSYRPMVSFRL